MIFRMQIWPTFFARVITTSCFGRAVSVVKVFLVENIIDHFLPKSFWWPNILCILDDYKGALL